jgi:hypothetical protein
MELQRVDLSGCHSVDISFGVLSHGRCGLMYDIYYSLRGVTLTLGFVHRCRNKSARSQAVLFRCVCVMAAILTGREMIYR